MSLAEDYTKAVEKIFKEQWSTRKGENNSV